jgi:O-antigen/teichoic acid export membrane protein
MLMLASTLNKAEYANFGFLYALQQGVTTLVIAGIIETVIGLSAKDKYDKDAIYFNALIAIAPLALVIIFFYTLYFVLFNKEHITYNLYMYLIVTFLSGVILGILSFFSKISRLEERHIDAILFINIPITLFFIIGFVFSYINNNGNIFFIGSLVGSIVSLSILYRRMQISIQANSRINFNIFIEILSNIRPYFFIVMAGWLVGYGNVFVIKIFLNDSAVATYLFIYTLSGVMLLVVNSMNQVWSPFFYKSYSLMIPNKIEHKSHMFYSLLTFVLGIVTSIMLIIYDDMIIFLGGQAINYINKELELMMILLSYIVYIPAWHCRNHLYVNLEGKLTMKITFISFMLGLLANIILIYMYREWGIYIGIFIMSIIQSIIFIIYTGNKWQMIFPFKSIIFSILLVLMIYYLIFISVNTYIVFCVFIVMVFFIKLLLNINIKYIKTIM